MMQTMKFNFRPSIFITLITLVVLTVLISLGLWQLDRAKLKQQTQRALEENLAQMTLDIEVPLSNDSQYRFRHVRLAGHFDNQHQYLLDNRIEKGRPGFLVITPFVYAGDKAVILVNRGWVPLGATRDDIPDIRVSEEAQHISGVLADLPGKLPDFGMSKPGAVAGWPKVIRDIELAEINRDLGYTIPPFLLQLAQSSEAAYMQNWQPVASGPEKNQSYAIQWFGMALVVLILYIGLNSRRREEK